MIYNHQDNQVSCYATITSTTTQALTTLLASHDPAAASGASAPLLHAPIAPAWGPRWGTWRRKTPTMRSAGAAAGVRSWPGTPSRSKSQTGYATAS
jgi:hypothetical protein